MRPQTAAAALVAAAVATGCGAPADNGGASDAQMMIGGTNWDTTVDTNDSFPFNGATVQVGAGCSGGYIGSQFVITAAHCVTAGTSVTLTNRFTGTQTARVWTRSGFEADNANDYAILVVNDPQGASVGSGVLDFAALNVNDTTTVVGYPGNLMGVMARSNGTVREFINEGRRYGHDADITGGSSGSFMGRLDGGTFRINGVQSWHWWADAASQASQACTNYVMGSCANAAVSINQFRQKAGEVRALETISPVADFDGDSRNEMLVKTAGGLALVSSEAGGAFRTLSTLTVGQRYGEWLLGADDQVLMARDFDGDGRAEIFLRSGWGLGFVELQANGRWTTVALHPYGTRIGGWLLGTVDTIVAAGDFTREGRQGFVIRSPWGIGLMRLNQGSLENVSLFPNGTALEGGWTLADEDVVVGSLPMTYGMDRILVRNTRGLATMYFDSATGYKPRVAAKLDNGQRAPGGWLLSAHDVIVSTGGDLNSDGYSEFAIRSGWGFGVIDAALQGIALMPFGSRAPGGWLLGAGDQIVGFAGVGAGTGKVLVVQSAWGLGFLGAQNGAFVTQHLTPYGTRFAGGWLFGRRDRIAAVGNLTTGNGGLEELVIRSGWGLGVIKYDATSRALVTHVHSPNETAVGAWTLKASDYVPAR